ncbi:MAG: FG-GAP repeat domain-containing protein [Planctomycetota bacterium]|jgi:hypothetical protein
MRTLLPLIGLVTLTAAHAGENGADRAGPSGPPTTAARTADGKHYISWKEHRIDDSALGEVGIGGSDGLAVADLDKDGHLDVVAVHENCAHHVRISFGSKDPDKWVSFTLAGQSKKGASFSPSVGGAEDAVIGDVNGDGRPDIVACGESGSVVYFEAPADPRKIADWKPVLLASPGAGKFKKKDSWIRVDLADLDGDGTLEVLGANKGGTDWACFRREGPASDPGSWKRLAIGKTRMPINIRAVDIDKDGDLDVVGGSRGEGKIVLFENLGNGKKWEEKWREIQITRQHAKIRGTVTVSGTEIKFSRRGKSQGFMLDFADLDGDGRLDIVTIFGPGPGWFKQPDHTTGLRLVDINGDKRLDLFVGGYNYTPRRVDTKTIVRPTSPCGRLAWFECGADPTKPWKRHDVSRRAQGMYDMFFVRDVNGDGLVDLVTTRGNSSPQDGTIWLEQVRTEKPGPAFTSAWPPDQESRQQPIPVDGK